MTKTLKNNIRSYVHFDGMAWPDPRFAADVNWRLRYSPQSITRSDQLVLASIADAYTTIISMTQRERNSRAARIKKESDAAIDRTTKEER